MSETKHSPSLWLRVYYANNGETFEAIVSKIDETHGGNIKKVEHIPVKQAIAAPELLTALKNMVFVYDDGHPAKPWVMQEAITAIEKAEDRKNTHWTND